MRMIIGATALRAAARLLLLLALALAAASSFFVPEAAAQKRIYISVDDHTDYMWSTDEAGYRDAFLQMLDYYLDQVGADYSLTAAGEPPGIWAGTAAPGLGLVGQVDLMSCGRCTTTPPRRTGTGRSGVSGRC